MTIWKLILAFGASGGPSSEFEWKRNEIEMCFLFAIHFDCNLFKFQNSMRMNELNGLNESHNQIRSGIIAAQNTDKLLFIIVFRESRWIGCFSFFVSSCGVLAFIDALLLSISAIPRVLNIRAFLFSRRNFYLICTRKKITVIAAAQAKSYWKYFFAIRILNFQINSISLINLLAALQQSVGEQWPHN